MHQSQSDPLILQRKQITAPPETLLQGAYDTMIASLTTDTGIASDRDYVEGQVRYQKGNAALFQYESQNGADPDLKAFAQQTLPKIEDHLQRALRLAEGNVVSGTFTPELPGSSQLMRPAISFFRRQWLGVSALGCGCALASSRSLAEGAAAHVPLRYTPSEGATDLSKAPSPSYS